MGVMAPDYAAAYRDLVGGLQQVGIWGRLGIQETRRRYRRTVIGPFWTTISMGIFILAAGLVWSTLWRQDLTVFLPYLAAGMITWVMITALLLEACDCFIKAEFMLKQISFPYSILVYSLVWRNFIVFLHNMLIFIAVAVFAGIVPSLATLAVVPALVLVGLNAVWFTLLLGLLCTRFRDLQQLISSLLQVGIFVTPVFWRPEQITDEFAALVYLNPLYYMIELVRQPLLGQVAPPEIWLGSIAIAVCGWALTLPFYARFRRRLPYWL
ncbi:MAG: ABC transporter permease [Pseudomonadota bacterium]